MRTRRNWLGSLGALAGAAAAVAAAIIVPATTGSSTVPTSDGGVIRLHLGADDYFRLDAPDGSGGYVAGVPAPITTSNCLASTSGVMTLGPIATSGGAVGLVDDGIGVRVKGEGKGAPCGRADGPDQGLIVKLAADVQNKKIDYAELDVEGKFNAVIDAQLFLNGQPVGTDSQGFGSNSDNGPDSADGDNERFHVSAASGSVFDEIRLTVNTSTLTGAFSLEGGADGTAPLAGGLGSVLGTSDSLFHLVEGAGELDCNDPPVTVGGTGVPDVTLTRLSNELGTDEDCVKIPYSLSTTPGQVDLDKDLGTQAQYNPQFTVEIAWEPEAASYPVARTTQIDYHDGNGFHTVVWCNGTPAAPELPGSELWCLVSQTNSSAGFELVQTTELYYGKGDPTWK